jgi:hypothetical protein
VDDIAYKLGFGARRRAEVNQELRERYSAPARPMPVKTPLTASQHILHLLLTVFTFGLWAPVWIIRSARGNQPTPGWSPPRNLGQ